MAPKAKIQKNIPHRIGKLYFVKFILLNFGQIVILSILCVFFFKVTRSVGRMVPKNVSSNVMNCAVKIRRSRVAEIKALVLRRVKISRRASISQSREIVGNVLPIVRRRFSVDGSHIQRIVPFDDHFVRSLHDKIGEYFFFKPIFGKAGGDVVLSITM